jgi:hypothetical protein
MDGVGVRFGVADWVETEREPFDRFIVCIVLQSLGYERGPSYMLGIILVII